MVNTAPLDAGMRGCICHGHIRYSRGVLARDDRSTSRRSCAGKPSHLDSILFGLLAVLLGDSGYREGKGYHHWLNVDTDGHCSTQAARPTAVAPLIDEFCLQVIMYQLMGAYSVPPKLKPIAAGKWSNEAETSAITV